MSLLFDALLSMSNENVAGDDKALPPYVLLITVPHFCIVTREVDVGCDANVDAYAQQIHAQNKHSELPLLGTEERGVVDENRPAGRNTKMRQRLRAKLENHVAYPRMLVLDVHSFPKGHKWGDEEYAQLVLLDYAEEEGVWSREATLLAAQLKREEFSVKIVRGAKLNDIQYEARQNKRPVVLLEIMDETTLAEATRIGHAVRRWIHGYFLFNLNHSLRM